MGDVMHRGKFVAQCKTCDQTAEFRSNDEREEWERQAHADHSVWLWWEDDQ